MSLPQTNRRSTADALDGAALLCSTACLLHCVALPLVIVALPALTRRLLIPESAHLWLLGFALPAALFALSLGYRMHHEPWPVVTGVAGLALLTTATLFDGGWETVLTVAGSMLVVSAHVMNLRLRQRCARCP